MAALPNTIIHRGGGGDDGNGGGTIASTRGEKIDNSENDKSSSSPLYNDYIPITALDDYGRSEQLRRAMQSAKRYGTPIVACICRSSSSRSSSSSSSSSSKEVKEVEEVEDSRSHLVEDVIIVCSLQRLHTRTGVVAASTTTTTTTTLPSSIHGMVRILATMDDDDDEQHDGYNNNNYDDENDVENTFQPPRHALQSAIVITGLVSDAEYLTDKLRSHMNKYWFRYDSSSCSTNAAAVAKMTRDVLLDCMGYNRNDETLSGSVSGGIGSAAASSSSSGGNDDDEDGAEEQQQQQQRAGRPLGICAFLLGIGSKHLYRPSRITVIEANGVSEEYVAYAMGMGSEIANSELAKKWRRHMGQNEAVDMMKGILQGVAKERGWLEDSTTRTEEEVNEEEKNKEDDDKRDADLMVVCEIVSSRGINTQYIKL